MKRIVLFLLFVFSLTSSSYAQIFNPVTWSYSTKDLGNNEYLVQFNASIEKGWHVYSQNIEDGGPIPTLFTFKKEAGYSKIGKVTEPEPHKEYDKSFDMELAWFEDAVSFSQKVKITKDVLVTGEFEFMVCDDEKCLPPEYVEFSFDLKYSEPKTQENIDVVKPDQNNTSTLKTEEKAKVTNPDQTTNTLPVAVLDTFKELTSIIKEDTSPNDFDYKKSSINLEQPIATCDVKPKLSKNQSLWTIFLLGFVGGLLALLTPCVFPMIPLTVSFFTKDSKGKGLRDASLYGFFILAVYLILSIPFHLLDSIDPNILNTISTNVYLNLTFFFVFIFFAFSFFGYFEITLPAALTNKADTASGAGGILGIFFMALTLALVSFSCTGPILGSLLAGSLSSNGGAIQLTAGMGGFGLALALPFAVFAAFPSLLNNIPKSGGWLSDVKVLLGFLEVALAFKFLSNADLVKHWEILPYELFLGIWIFVSVLTVLYFLNILKFPHSSPFKKWGLMRIALILFFSASAIYLTSGFRYNEESKTFTSLSLLSGLAPPSGYSWIYPNDCPLDLNCFHDYEKGLAYAKKVNKPIMLDFTGHACVNCRKMEEHVWSDPAVFKIINEKYVLISLYVDDRQKLPIEYQHEIITSNGSKKKIRTIGNKWATFQTETFKNNSQPWYPLLSPNEELLLSPVGNTPEIEKFRAYLECGLNASKN